MLDPSIGLSGTGKRRREEGGGRKEEGRGGGIGPLGPR
jgi:hypothetical protein